MRWIFASCIAGLVLGLASRLVMRFVALESGLRGSFSAGGSIEVIVFGALVGAPAAWVFFLLRRGSHRARPWVGALWGLALFAVLAAVPPPAATSALAGTPDTPAATAGAFALMFAAWGAWLDLIVGRMTRARA